jgi:hypothetical protein
MMQLELIKEQEGISYSHTQQKSMKDGSACAPRRRVAFLQNLARAIFLAYTLLRLMTKKKPRWPCPTGSKKA